MLTIKANLLPKNEQAIRKLAHDTGVPVNALLAPYLNAIAEGTLRLVPHFPAPVHHQEKAA